MTFGRTAGTLNSSAVVAGLSTKMPAAEQSLRLGSAWEQAPAPKQQFVFHVVYPDLDAETFRIGPHTPTMKAEDIELVHRLWLNLTRQPGLDKLHHSDIVTEALRRFAQDYEAADREQILLGFRCLEASNSVRRLVHSGAESSTV